MIRCLRFFCCVCLPLLPLAGLAQQQTWRSADGQHSFQGEFVRLHNEVVTLRGTDGVEIQVPLVRLDSESQTRARAARLSPEQRRNLLLLHETPHYRVTFHNERNLMRFQQLENGNETPHPIVRLDLQHFETVNQIREFHQFVRMDAPLRQEGTTVIWRGRMANDVIFEFEFELGDNGVEFGYRREVPASLRDANLNQWIYFRLPAWLTWNEDTRKLHGPLAPQGISREEIPAMFKDFVFRRRGHDNRRLQNLDFTEVYAASAGMGRQSFIEIRGPFSQNGLEFSSPRREEEGSLGFWFYEGGRPAYMGFTITTRYPGGPDPRRIPGRFGIHSK